MINSNFQKVKLRVIIRVCNVSADTNKILELSQDKERYDRLEIIMCFIKQKKIPILLYFYSLGGDWAVEIYANCRKH